MPELPEVEAQRRTLEAVALNTRIALLVANEQGGGPRDGEFDDKIMDGLTPCDLATSVQGRWVLAVKRRGKQLWVELGDTKGGACQACLLLHFGWQTGAMVVRGMVAPQYKSFSIDTSVWPPRCWSWCSTTARAAPRSSWHSPTRAASGGSCCAAPTPSRRRR